ncbi:MAG: hypothetical protein AAFX85_01900, partial [Pseudomonadota bacterium]
MKRIALWSSLALVALLVLLLATASLWLYTPVGPWSVNRLLPHLLPAGVEVEGLDGRLAGALHIDHVHVESDGLVLDIYDIEARYQPFGVLLAPRSFTVDALNAARVNLRLLPADTPAPATADEPFALPPAPVDVALASLIIGAVEVTSADDWAVSAEELSASGRWDRQGLTVAPVEGSAQLSADALPAPITLTLNSAAYLPVNFDESLRLDVDLEARSSAYPTIAATAHADGALGQTIQLALQISQPATANLTATLTGLLDPSPLAGQGTLDLPMPVQLREIDASLAPVEVSGELAATLANETLSLMPTLRIGLDAFEGLRAEQRAAFVDGELRLDTSGDNPRLDLSPLGVRLGDGEGSAGRLQVTGQGDLTPSLTLQLEVDRVDPAWVSE